YFDVVSVGGRCFSSCVHGTPELAAEEIAKEVGEAGTAAILCLAEIKPVKIEIDILSAGFSAARISARRHALAVKAVLIVHLPLFRIGKNVVGFLQLLELFFRRFVSGIQVGMVFPGELSKRSTNILG